MASATQNSTESDDDYIPPVKLKKTTNEDDHNDLYCFECHDEGDVICCDSCPRVYHSKCLGLTTLPDGDWTCPECTTIQSSSNTNYPSIDEFHTMLKFALRRMKSHPQSTPFMQPVDPKLVPEYLDYIIHPMDLETIEKNIDAKKYASTDAFIADVKWITHNSVVFNGNQSKFTTIARALLKIARHEMTEIEICSECYLRSAQPLSPDWFAEPCRIPHTLCWAKMKGYQPWPAKVLRIVNDEVDVRFFGQHDRAWVSINNCFVLSKEYPGVEKKKSNSNFEKSLTELQTHIDQLKTLYGTFTYAPLQTPLSKTKPFKFVSVIDDCVAPTYVKNITLNSNMIRASIKCTNKQTRSPLPSPTIESTSTIKTAIKRQSQDSNDQQQQQLEPAKRARLLSRPSEENSTTNSNRIVLRIRKPSEDLPSSRSDISNSSSSHQLTIQIKDTLSTLREEDENQSLSQPENVFDIFNQVLIPTKIDEEPPCLTLMNESTIPLPVNNNQITNDALPSSPADINIEDVRLSINALLDTIDALKTISEVSSTQSLPTKSLANESRPEQLQFAERRSTTKHSRKSRLQHRIITTQPKPFIANNTILTPVEAHLNEHSLSPISSISSRRPLSISPASIENLDEITSTSKDDLPMPRKQSERTKSIEALSVKSEPIDNDEHKKRQTTQASPLVQPPISNYSSSPATKSFLISPPANAQSHKNKTPVPPTTTSSSTQHPTTTTSSTNAFAPRISSTVSQKTSWPAPVPCVSSIRHPPTTAQKRPAQTAYPPTASRNSNNANNPSAMRIPPILQPQSFDAFPMNTSIPRRSNGVTPLTLPPTVTPPIPTRNPLRMPPFNNHPIRPSIEDHQTPGEIQMIIKTFNDKFQQLLTDFTVKIETALESNRIKYEKELEETRRTYRMSINELRTITTQQVQEMHNSLELQYWTRLSEMRNRYESNLQQQFAKSSKQLNGSSR